MWTTTKRLCCNFSSWDDQIFSTSVGTLVKNSKYYFRFHLISLKKMCVKAPRYF